MFERFTEKARRVIFFARYESSQFGSPAIETEHLLLGLLREDRALTVRFVQSRVSPEAIRKEIAERTPQRQTFSTSIDLPLSDECKRLLAFAASEANRMKHLHIGTEHLLLGLLHEKNSMAATLLAEHHITLDQVRAELEKTGAAPSRPLGAGQQPVLARMQSALKVADLEQSVAFYAKLGFHQVAGREAEGIAVLSNGPAWLVLYRAGRTGDLLCFFATDMRALEAQLQASGLQPEPATSADGMLLQDPDGNLVYVVAGPF